MEYKVIEQPKLKHLMGAVNLEIVKGWRPQGGVAKSYVGDYMQAMIKE